MKKLVSVILLAMAILVAAHFAEAGIVKISINASHQAEVKWMFSQKDTQGGIYHKLFPGRKINWKEVLKRISLPKGMSSRRIPVGTTITIAGQNGDLDYLLPSNHQKKAIASKQQASAGVTAVSNDMEENQSVSETARELTLEKKIAEAKANDLLMQNAMLEKSNATLQESVNFLTQENTVLHGDVNTLKELISQRVSSGIYLPKYLAACLIGTGVLMLIISFVATVYAVRKREDIIAEALESKEKYKEMWFFLLESDRTDSGVIKELEKNSLRYKEEKKIEVWEEKR